MLSFYFHSFVNLFAVIDPVGIVPIFLGLTQYQASHERRKIALMACVISAVTLVCFAYGGERLLSIMGISHPAFQVAGGILLLLAAIEMVVGHHAPIMTPTKVEVAEANLKTDITVFPLAIPLIAGPGAMTTLVLQMKQVSNWFHESLIVLIMLSVIVLTYLCLYMADHIKKFLGVTGMNVISRVFGIVLAALAAEFILKGIRLAFFQ